MRLANAEMVRALRVVTVNRGIDPRDFSLLPFGGAGPMHAADLAAEMGMARLICPRAGGVLSALGLLASARRRDTARTVMMSPTESDRRGRGSGRRGPPGKPRRRDGRGRGDVSYELRYEGQSFELPVEAGPEPSRDELVKGSRAAHERRYGFEVPDAPVELVAIRLALEGAAPEPEPRAAEGELEESSRRVHFGDEWHHAQVSRGEPPEGSTFEGPAVLEMPESTLVLPPGWTAEVDEHGSVIAQAEEA